MIFVNFQDTEEEEEEVESGDDELATLGDDVLDEITEDDDEVADDTEGFGTIPEEDDSPEKPEAEDDPEEESLEEDAEDVDFDTFDDIDEM